MDKVTVGITLGDPSGIGPEITIKALALKDLWEKARIVVIGNRAVLNDALNIVGSNLDLFEIKNPMQSRGYGYVNFIECGIPKRLPEYGKVSREAGEAAYSYVIRAIDLAMGGKIDAVVTGPLHKEALSQAGCPYPGHTEIFASKTNTTEYAMMLAAGDLNVVHVSTHVSLRQSCDLVTKERVLIAIRLACQGLEKLGIKKPRIGVAGLNPHAGEGGLFGIEELNEIIPAIEAARQHGINVQGPLSPDIAFVKGRDGQYDAIVAMYHDQGHIPVKMAGFVLDHEKGRWSTMQGVNITLGLPIIRTSVDHGVAFGKAGQGTANPQSMVEAIRLATVMAHNSKQSISYNTGEL
jgi:4-hydroxythreonine-4-phosphate dehydrogenase